MEFTQGSKDVAADPVSWLVEMSVSGQLKCYWPQDNVQKAVSAC